MDEIVFALGCLCVLLSIALVAVACTLYQAKKSLDEITEESMLSLRDAALEKRVLAKTYAYVRESLDNHYDKCHSKTDVL